MKTLASLISILCWVILGLLGLESQITWAATGEMEYRFEHISPILQQIFNFGYKRGIAVGPDDSIWVTGDSVVHFHADGHLIHRFSSQIRFTSPFNGTPEIALAADGSFWTYYPSNTQNHIAHYSAEGTFIAEFGKQGNGAGELDSPQSIAIEPDNSVWVADKNNYRIQHFSSNGNFITQFGAEGQAAGKFGQLEQIKLTPSNSIWVKDNGGSRLQHFKTDGTFINQLIAQGTANNQFHQADDFTVATDGSLWVADTEYQRLQHFDTNGRFIEQFEVPAHYDNSKPLLKMALASDGNLWVASNDATNPVWHFKPDGTLIAAFGADGQSDGRFNFISGIKIANDDSLWVADYADTQYQNKRFQHFTSIGQFIESNTEVSSLYFPDNYIAPDGTQWSISSFAFSSCCANSTIRHLNAEGTLISEFNLGGYSRLEPHGYDIDFTDDNTLWLLKTASHSVQHFKPDSTLLAQFGGRGNAVGQFNYPSAITLVTDGSVWIADTLNYRIQHINPDGSYIEQLGSIGTDIGQFNQPADIQSASNNSVWVADRGNNRLQKFAPRPKAHTTHPYKAIILAGSETIQNHINPSWAGIWQTALKAVTSLEMQGFKRDDEILFLTAGNTQNDLDSKVNLSLQIGYVDLADPSLYTQSIQVNSLQTATKDSLHQAIIDWAKDSTDVVIFLVGQTSTGQFQLNATETFTAQELSGWLAELEKSLPTTGKVTVVIESPDAGSFVTALANPSRPRYVIASTQAGQPALMADHGVNSFSYTFWSRVMDGAPLVDAFLAGQQGVGPFEFNGQAVQPAGDANGNGQADAQDAVAVGNYCLGMCNKTATQLPAINLPRQPSLLFKSASSLDFNVSVKAAANTNLLETWALVQRPANALSLEKIPLSCDAMQHCNGRYQHFDAPGQYRVHFYSLDSQYQLNEPVFLDITIQPENTSSLPAEYDSRQGLLTLRDVEVTGQHYQAGLQYHNGLYHLLTMGLTSNVLSPSAHFDAATNLLVIPLARVNGQDYQGSFRLVENYLFELLSAQSK